MPAEKYWKQSDATDLRPEAAIHEGEGTIIRRLFFREQSQLPIRFDIWELPPGASEGNHRHAGEDQLEEIYYVLAGQGYLWVEGEAVSLAAGEAVLVPAGVDHGLYNNGTQPLRLVLLWGKPQAAD